MSFYPKLKHGLLIATAVVIAITALAWSGSGTGDKYHRFNEQDSVPSRKHHHTNSQSKKIREKDPGNELMKPDHSLHRLNDCMEDVNIESIGEEIENAIKDVHQELLELSIDPETIQVQIDESIEGLDIEKINMEIERAVQQAHENIDIKEIESEISRSINKALDEMKTENFRKSVEEVNSIDGEDTGDELENASEEVENNKIDAGEEIDESNEALKSYQEMIDLMENDGLINANKDYSIVFRNEALYINGKKQSQEQLKKYRKYFKEDDIKLYRKNGRFNINID